MFSVGASPFNSRARQLYGGWTKAEAEAANSPWAERTWHSMSAKYNPSLLEREASKAWLKGYAELPKDLRRYYAREGRKYWNKAIKPALTDAQRAEIFNAFEGVGLSDTDAYLQWKANTLRNAPYPAINVLSTYPYLTAPRSVKVEGMADLVRGTYGPYARTVADMWTAARANRRANRAAVLAARRAALENRWLPEAPLPPAMAPPALSPEQRALVEAAAAAAGQA